MTGEPGIRSPNFDFLKRHDPLLVSTPPRSAHHGKKSLPPSERLYSTLVGEHVMGSQLSLDVCSDGLVDWFCCGSGELPTNGWDYR